MSYTTKLARHYCTREGTLVPVSLLSRARDETRRWSQVELRALHWHRLQYSFSHMIQSIANRGNKCRKLLLPWTIPIQFVKEIISPKGVVICNFSSMRERPHQPAVFAQIHQQAKNEWTRQWAQYAPHLNATCYFICSFTTSLCRALRLSVRLLALYFQWFSHFIHTPSAFFTQGRHKSDKVTIDECAVYARNFVKRLSDQ